jgi:hypothetical protein
VWVSLFGLASIAASPRRAAQGLPKQDGQVQYPHRDPSATNPAYRSGLRRSHDYYTLCCGRPESKPSHEFQWLPVVVGLYPHGYRQLFDGRFSGLPGIYSEELYRGFSPSKGELGR